MNKFCFALILSAWVLLPSCQQLEPDVFDKPSSARLSDFLEEVRTALSSEQQGWTLDYFPSSQYAGVTFVLNFTDQKVTASLETDPATKVTSTYALKTDNGPVLSFDTYNKVLHAYATPNSSQYQAMGGDFEFEIRSFDKEAREIVMIGKRSRNTCTLRPLTQSAEEYFAAVKRYENSLTVAAFEGSIGDSLVVGFIDDATRTISISPKDDESQSVDVRYVVTDKALRLMTPLTYNGVEFKEFVVDSATETVSGADCSFHKIIPKGYLSFDQLLGQYNLSYNGGTFTVTLEDDGTGKGFNLAGLSSAWKLPVRYHSGRGRLAFNVQQIGASSTHTYWFCALDASANQFSWSENCGMYSEVDDEFKPDFTLSFVDDGKYDGGDEWTGWVSFYVTAFSGSPSSDTYDYESLPSSWNFADGQSYLQGPITIQKIVE
ncbi:MAG: DUF4302 domain-containing protein [Bacteroidales bacterium]|nr:DUF4302 domain-containing protein [Bacteroidales bacterium]